MYDCLTHKGRVFAGSVPDSIVELWIAEMGSPEDPALICQIELYAVVLLRFLLQGMLSNRRVLIFVDNDTSRFCLIRGLSKSSAMSRLIVAFDSLDSFCAMVYWLERVASFSNIADGPSRGSSDEALMLVGARLSFDHHGALARFLL